MATPGGTPYRLTPNLFGIGAHLLPRLPAPSPGRRGLTPAFAD
ncbi:hypothetical protein [Actinacidiphila acidipaludis]|nr:hypothetical protein [Streptomyces acidipaludis]